MKKILLKIILSILSVLLLYGIAFYFSFFQGDVYVKNGVIEGSAVNKSKLQNFKGIQIKYELNEPNPTTVSNLNIFLLGDEISKNTPILFHSQRYYLSLEDLSKHLNFTYSNNNLEKDNLFINFSSEAWIINNVSYNPRSMLLKYNNKNFISLSDIEYLFNLTAVFNEETNSINLLESATNKLNNNNSTLPDGKVALFRFEDVTAGGSFINTLNQAKFKAIADYLYLNNFKFNVAWVPRYIHPENGIDNDLLTQNTFANAGFVNMIDYLINSNGQIGLHGYTHQSNSTISTVGSELTKKVNASNEETTAVIEKAIFTAKSLNIPIAFFESPHYHATSTQKKIIGSYFQYQYEPYSLLNYIGLKTTKHNNLFIPTPLSYVKNNDPSSIIKKLKNPPPNFLASMFYHPTLEFDYISFNENQKSFQPIFQENSIIKQLIPAFLENGYTSIHPTDFSK